VDTVLLSLVDLSFSDYTHGRRGKKVRWKAKAAGAV
jgi:hypothetical protein